ncbi:ATP-binding protein [Salmonirosea aquatica]|uniref:histidine kinase n=1 Tax=Salmonirosea aquatica TaxID=2654236 RepID=A0A7C9FPR0_9BACT|nr:response regulator [Cytophagaceae bacterium SJW1-29]
MKKIGLLFVSLLFALNLAAQVITLDAQTSTPFVISDQVKQFVDSTAALSLAKVQNNDFQPVGKSVFHFPFSDNAHWYRFTLRNDTPERHTWYLEWGNSIVEQVECYLPRPDGTYQVLRGGTLVPESDRAYDGPIPYFELGLATGQQKTVYLRVRSQRGHRSDIVIHDARSLRRVELDDASTSGFANGMVLLRLFFVLLLAIFAVKDRVFRAYSFLLVLRSLGFWGIRSDLGELFTDNPDLATLLNFLSYHLAPIGYVLMVKALFPFERLPGLIRHGLNAILVAVLLLGVIVTVDYNWKWLLASQYLVLLAQIFIFGMYIYALAKRLKINWYYSAPFLLGIGSYFFLVLSSVGGIDADWVFGVAYLLFFSEIFVFGLFLGKIILDYRRERETAQQKATLQEAQAAQLKELDALKTNFFANISHEFRTPLTMLVGPLEDFRQEQPANPLIPAMQRSVRRLRSLIDQLLDLSRLEAGHLKADIVEADLAVFLRQLFASFESLAQSRTIIFNYQQNFGNHTARFDPDKLEKIVTNLLSNAFKFTPEGGRVTVDVTFTNSDLTLLVRDYGIGIEAERLSHIFDRFYRVESTGQNNTEGAGIGLSLVHELVKALKGQIRVESEPGRGSIFTLRLPTDATTWAEYTAGENASNLALATPEADVPNHGDTLPEQGSRPDDTPLLLIVEDNPDLRSYMLGIFGKNYRIIEGHDGLDGLERAFEEIPDLVICDVMMPRLDGFGFCKKLKSDPRTSHIPVVMLTAKATLNDRLTGLELGADDYLTKPFVRAELELRVQNMLRQRDLMRRKYSRQLTDPTARNQDSPVVESIDEKFLRKAIRTVEELGSDSQFGIENLCDALNTSRSNLHRKLKALTGQSTTEFIRSIRIRRAAELLKQPDASVSEVAYQVGFESPSYFSKSFSDQMGVSPTDWVASKKKS